MKLRHSLGLSSVFCVLLASCYPVNEGPGRPPGPGPAQPGVVPPLTPEQQKVKEAEELKKKEEAKKQAELKKEEELKNGGTGGNGGNGGGTPNPDKTPPPQKTDYQYANKVPGKEGFVFSPYNNKVIDVRDIPSGQLVQDPTYPLSEKKYFRVP